MIAVGNQTYPIFIGFLSGADLVTIAEAPAFTEMTTHEQIATNILTPPIKDWQRPLDQARVQKIADVYSNNSELMPNPVLLSENALLGSIGYSVTPQMVHNQTTGMCIVDIPGPALLCSVHNRMKSADIHVYPWEMGEPSWLIHILGNIQTIMSRKR